MPEKPDRLYGRPGAEVLYLTPVEVFEATIADDVLPDIELRIEIEEWTVADKREHFPKGDNVVDSLLHNELASAEVTEGWWEGASDAVDEEIIEAFQKALDLWASKVPYWMADQHVASHWITWDADGNPLIDGQRIYTEVPS